MKKFILLVMLISGVASCNKEEIETLEVASIEIENVIIEDPFDFEDEPSSGRFTETLNGWSLFKTRTSKNGYFQKYYAINSSLHVRPNKKTRKTSVLVVSYSGDSVNQFSIRHKDIKLIQNIIIGRTALRAANPSIANSPASYVSQVDFKLWPFPKRYWSGDTVPIALTNATLGSIRYLESMEYANNNEIATFHVEAEGIVYSKVNRIKWLIQSTDKSITYGLIGAILHSFLNTEQQPPNSWRYGLTNDNKRFIENSGGEQTTPQNALEALIELNNSENERPNN